MNIVTLPVMPGKKLAKHFVYQANAGFNNSMIDLKCLLPETVLENRENALERIMARGKQSDEVILFEEPERFPEPLVNYRLQTEQLGLRHTVARMPSYPFFSQRRDVKDQDLLVRIIKEGMKACYDCKYILIDPWHRNMNSDSEWKENICFLLEFAELAHEMGMMILIQNSYYISYDAFKRGALSDTSSLLAFLKELNQKSGYDEKIFGLSLDFGINNLLGQDFCSFVIELKDYIKAVVLRENNGIDDSYLLPFCLSVEGRPAFNWREVVLALRAIDFDGELILDFHDMLNSTSPLLRDTLFMHAGKIAKNLMWNIGMENMIKRTNSRVLFGAGNMCRNYLQNYGEEYPPLYTCDNNKNTWGKTFEGLEIKNPEELKNLPADCQIIICNLYYDEISKQLNEMGIRNSIGKYSDEYLPLGKAEGTFDAELRIMV